MDNNHKNKILEILKEGEKSTTELSSIINRDYYYCIKLLEELKKEDLIIKIEIGKFTFWKLKNEIQNNSS